jgi:hypothetical protein
VQVRGSGSWRFAEDDAQFLHLALAIRDCAGLPLGAESGESGAPTGPPRLTSPPPAAGPLPATETAAQQWRAWFARLLTGAGAEASQRPAVKADGDWLRARVDARQAIFDPPGFATLAGAPELRDVATTTFDAVRDWSRQRPRQPDGQPAFSWTTVRDVADQVGHDHGVAPDALDASAIVLDVDGPWWQVVALGVIAVSRATCADPDSARQVLRTAFVSGLAR